MAWFASFIYVAIFSGRKKVLSILSLLHYHLFIYFWAMVDKALQLEEPSTLDLFDRWGSRIPTLQYGDWYLYSFSSMVIRTNSPVWRLFFYLRAQWQLGAGQVIMTCIFLLLRDFHILNCLLCVLLFTLMPVVGLIFNSGSEPVHFGYIDIIWSFVSMDA